MEAVVQVVGRQGHSPGEIEGAGLIQRREDAKYLEMKRTQYLVGQSSPSKERG